MVVHAASSPSVDLVRHLIASRFPEWRDLPVSVVPSAGTANDLFALGDEMVIRLPATESAHRAIEKEQIWLPRLEQHISLALPTPVAVAGPGDGFDFAWAVYRWLPGEDGWARPIGDLASAAMDLANFITELRAVDTTGGPAPGKHNSWRGVPLEHLDDRVREAIRECGARIDMPVVTALWELALAQPGASEPTWVHGDIQPGNWLSTGDRISAIIDWGLLGVGDPAVDLLPAWNLLDRNTRGQFRRALGVDDATWIRGQGWAVFQSVMALPYYWETNPVMVAMARRQLTQLLGETV